MIRVVRPVCEYERNPIGIETLSPRFSWQLESDERGDNQKAFRIVVASSRDLLNQDSGDKWDSGRIESPETVNIPYEGSGLVSGEVCYWKVLSWDNADNSSSWTEAARFEMGLLDDSDWGGSWIAADAGISSPLFRKEFVVQGDVERARLYICGLGWHEAYFNGEKIGDHEFDPAPTWFDNIFSFETGSRVLYVTHDVTEMLRPGKNVIGAMLGHGWYSSDTGRPPGRTACADRPVLIAQLNVDMKDGSRTSVVTDQSWQTHPGPIIANDLFSGESYDARLEQDGWNAPEFELDWDNAELSQSPSGRLVSQNVEPEKVQQRFEAIRKLKSGNDSWIFDFGQFMSGWVEITMEGPEGAMIVLRFAGRVNYETSSLDMRNTDYGDIEHLNLMLGASFGDSYVLRGGGVETWHPRFTVHGFRYVEVVGYPGEPGLDTVVGCAVNSDVQPIGEFSCSKELFNSIHHNVWWTFRGSFQGIPQDAADRAERCGWLGDPGFVAEDYMYNFRDIRFWSKWLDDISDTQRDEGMVSYIAPPNWGENSYRFWPCWECAYTLFVWHCYSFYDDKRLLERHYEGVKRQVEYFRDRSDNLILDDALGDHMEPSHSLFSNPSPLATPTDVCGTAYFFACSRILSRMADIIGHKNDAVEYASLAESIKAAFEAAFLNLETGEVSTGSQTANALALYLDLVSEEHKGKVLDNLISDINDKSNGHLATGIIGTDALEQVLPALGRSDVMYSIASKTTHPSWGFGVVHGQTTQAEDYGCSHHYSVSMKMQGSIEKFFYKDVAGISPAAPGFKSVAVHPKLVGVGELTSAQASIESIRGKVAVDWQLEDGCLTLGVFVPPGVEADVRIPLLDRNDVKVTEGGATVWKNGAFIGGVTGLSGGLTQDDGTISVTAGSGSYEFIVSRLSG